MNRKLTRKQILLLFAILSLALFATCDVMPVGRMPEQEKKLELMKRKLEQQMLNQEADH